MDKAADEFFALLRAAGLRTGICIRPPLYAPVSADGKKIVPWKEMQTIQGRDWVTREPEVEHIMKMPCYPFRVSDTNVL